MDRLDKIKLLTKCDDDDLLYLLLEQAEAFVMNYTGRKVFPSELEQIVCDIAVINYNRMGTEGESSRSEGGISISIDEAPKHIYSVLNKYRLARVSGNVFEKKQS